MALKLYFHPLASYCWKALIALYENDTPFEPHIVDLGDEAARAAFFKLSPIGKMPVLRDDARNLTIPEATNRHRISVTSLSRRDAARAGGCGARWQTRAARPLL